MAAMRPRFSLTAGSLASSSSSSVAGPSRFVAERSLDVPIDSLRVTLAESGGASPGDPVGLDLGDEDAVERVFTGTIAEIRPRLDGCQLFCLGTMLGLVDLRVSSFYRAQSAGDVVRDLVGQAGLQAGEIADGIDLPHFAVERRVGAHAQLRRLAERLGYSLFSDRTGKIHFRGLGPAASLSVLGGALSGVASAAAGAASAAAAALGIGGGGGIAYGKHMLDCAAHLQPALGRTIVVGGESPMSGFGEDKSFWLAAADSQYEGSSGDGPELLVTDPAARTKDMAGRFAAGYATSFNRRSRDIRISVLGLPALELGDSTGGSGAPVAALNASGYVKALRHRFGFLEGFVTDIVVSAEGGT
jgi:hypothetical protein